MKKWAWKTNFMETKLKLRIRILPSTSKHHHLCRLFCAQTGTPHLPRVVWAYKMTSEVSFYLAFRNQQTAPLLFYVGACAVRCSGRSCAICRQTDCLSGEMTQPSISDQMFGRWLLSGRFDYILSILRIMHDLRKKTESCPERGESFSQHGERWTGLNIIATFKFWFLAFLRKFSSS